MLFIVVFILFFSSRVSANTFLSCPIIPAPQFSEKIESQFMLSSKTIIFYNEVLATQAFYLQSELLRYKSIPVALDGNLKKSDSSGSKIILNLLSDKQKENAAHGAFSIRMSDNEIMITSNTKEGVFYGITSFIQLTRLSESKSKVVFVDCWNIKDKPRFEWRGLMLDESRHFFGKRKVKQILDWMALYKMNKFHWHLTDSPGWRIEIKQYPKLTFVGGIGGYTNPYTKAKYYTQEEIKDIVRYASERFIDIIPEIDMPGHATAANRAYPEFSGGGSDKHPDFTFNPGKEEVYTYLTDILREVDALFPSQIIHLGGDEVHYGNDKWHTDEAIQALMKREKLKELPEVESYFFQRMSDSLFNMNNKLAAWDEIAESNIDPAKTIVYFWRQNKLEQLQKSLDKGYPIVMTPRLPMYLDYAQDTLQVHGVPWRSFGVNSYDKIYHFNPYGYDVNYPQNSKILGVQVNIWTERIITENRLDYMMFPRIAALAENAWTESEQRNIKNFDERLKKQFDLYRRDGIYYYDPFEPSNTGEPIY